MLCKREGFNYLQAALVTYAALEIANTAFGVVTADDLFLLPVVTRLLGTYLCIYGLYKAARRQWSSAWLELFPAATLLHAAMVLVSGWHGLLLTPSGNTRWECHRGGVGWDPGANEKQGGGRTEPRHNTNAGTAVDE